MSLDSIPSSVPPWLGVAALGAAGLLYLLSAMSRPRSPRLLDFLLETHPDEAWLRDLIERT